MKNLILFLAFLSLLGSYVFAAGGSDTKKDGEEIIIAGIVFQNDLYMRTVQIGMAEAGKKYGITVLLGNSDGKIDKEAQLVDTYIARGVDALIITPISEDGGSDAALQRVADEGIKIIYFNTKTKVPGVTHIATPNSSVGIAAGKAAREFIMGGHAGQDIQVGTLSYRSVLPEQAEQRSGGFFDQIKDLPGVSLVSEQEAWLAEKAIQVVGDMITANPNLKIIHAANEGGTVGAVQAVRNAGRAGDIFVFGTDGSDQIVQMLLSEDNVLQSAAAQGPFEVGAKSVEAAIKSLRGEAVDPEVIIPPRVLLRTDPDDLRAFQAELKSYQ